jgi:UDP-N-acetylmuramate dehydrogenase
MMPATLEVRGSLTRNAPLAPHTSWKVGGPADTLFIPADREDLLAYLAALPQQEPLTWIGLGSNLLVRDGGVRGTVIALHRALDRLEQVDDTTVHAEAGVHCARLAKLAERAGLAGLGFMAGIPGTVGGALAMNAGAWGGETWPAVREVEVALAGGETAWLPREKVRHGYRHVEMPAGALGFLGARFEVTPDEDGAHAAATRSQLARRKATQPVGRPSAGSTFRNPPGDFAARLIEAAGLKNHRIGGAWVSEQHANFIITGDDARAADVESLIAHVQRVVAECTGVSLQPEVRIVGEVLDSANSGGGQ